MRTFSAPRSWLALSVMLCGLVAAVAPLPASAAAPAALPHADTVAACVWTKPGRDPFMGNVVGAVDRYTDIPAPVRAKLKQRMAARQYDDIAEISRDRIEGRSSYGSAITDMHFGTGRICKTVTRDAWTADMRERGLVYCESGQCIIVPTVCRNVSRISRGAESPAALVDGPLLFDPPGAGLLPTGLVNPTGRAQPLGLAQDAAPVFEAPQEQAYAQAGFPGIPSFGGSPIVVIGRPGLPAGVLPPVLNAVPEPSSIALLVMGGVLVGLVSRRRGAKVSPSATA